MTIAITILALVCAGLGILLWLALGRVEDLDHRLTTIEQRGTTWTS